MITRNSITRKIITILTVLIVPLSFLFTPVFADDELPYILADLNLLESGSATYQPTEFNNQVYFLSDEGDIWKTDGTVENTEMLIDISAIGIELVGEFEALGDELLFTALNFSSNACSLWKTDGTVEGTVKIKDIITGQNGAAIITLLPMGDEIFFTSGSNVGLGSLWKTDGTTDGTLIVKENLFIIGMNLLVNNDLLFFAGMSIMEGAEIWVSDGTEGGTHILKDINPGMGDGINIASFESQIVPLGSYVYFSATPSTDAQLWRSDGTEEGTTLVKDIAPSSMYNWNNTLYLNAQDGDDNLELWKSDGTEEGTTLVKDINASGSSSPTSFASNSEYLLFAATDETSKELWMSDGTEEGTELVKTINTGGNSQINHLYSVDETVYFAADNGSTGTELWKTDGTEEGTVLVSDMVSGATGSNPSDFKLLGDTLLFMADNSDGDSRLWALDVSEEDTTPPIFGTLPDSEEVINITNGQVITTNPYVIQVKPTDINGISSVKFFVDDILICTETEADEDGVYSCAWDTGLYHSDITVYAYDTDLNESEVLGRTATVDLDAEPTSELTVLPKTGGLL